MSIDVNWNKHSDGFQAIFSIDINWVFWKSQFEAQYLVFLSELFLSSIVNESICKQFQQLQHIKASHSKYFMPFWLFP